MDHRRAITENVIAAEQHLVAAFVEATMARLVARCVQNVQFAAAEIDPVVVVVLKIFAAQIPLARAVNAEFGAAAFAQRQGAAGVIAVNMGQ